jgi:hypothetical protein
VMLLTGTTGATGGIPTGVTGATSATAAQLRPEGPKPWVQPASPEQACDRQDRSHDDQRTISGLVSVAAIGDRIYGQGSGDT